MTTFDRVKPPGEAWTTQPEGVGVPRTTRYTVPFDAAGLSDGTGYVLFTPTVGDEILDIAVRFPTVFDGTTPFCDVGTGVTATGGLFSAIYGRPQADNPLEQYAGDGLSFPSGIGNPTNLLASLGASQSGYGTPKVTAANPIRVWVTQDGQINGADPVSTQGVVEIVVTIVAPVDVP